MTATSARAQPHPMIEPGQPAPDFTLPAIHAEGTISLTDYRGRQPLLLAISRGLYCPFCRRYVAQLAVTRQKLLAHGIETLAVVASDVPLAREYLSYRPTDLPLAADPDYVTHRAYGLPAPVLMPEFRAAAQSAGAGWTTVAEQVTHVAPLPDPEPGSPLEATLTRDQEARAGRLGGAYTQPGGQFLIDTDGIVRWANVEFDGDRPARGFHFPTDAELLDAARVL